ncbi:MAG: serine protease [Oscillatoriales cyanobacterium]|uniref:Serine protease n=1 Tax=Microcoleus anatoxicus PTRS2 TaxID=2705321 RepID=A0ABU8YML2_9CYAN|nr:MAG: serine protease [Oscillatoriales cyanobacterium]TAE03421.1 MAG: serine protease [Oscillatoriales cyanobacterium]TAF04648.1 MAG: serine protease [Oscillatoriales cyanobacterium]TAF34563.1 MAG: serine protease [Oscillatoriales cyanobacterium]TAF63683.1 MAG: serine protease [Oscillatoriales cyanobacterium]
MNLGFNRSNYLPGIVAATVAVATIVISEPAMAKTAREIAKIAFPTTVQINNNLTPNKGGSGVIIAKKGKTYTVLTANHVVINPNTDYIIRTAKKKEHKVTEVKGFQDNGKGTDLAVVMFESDEEYSVAPISNSDEADIGSGLYVSGYPLATSGSQEREYAFTNGQVANVRSSNERGYTMRYDAVTRRGMSGGPVFDVSGRVIGIHGEGESGGLATVKKNDEASQESGQSGQTTKVIEGQEEVKTGLNYAIPINTFVEMMSKVGMDKSALKVDNKAPENVDAEKVKQSDVDNWAADFGKEILKDVIRGGIRRILPF